MCVICIKKPGVSFPSNETIEYMFYTNPDGAGFVYSMNGEVHIRKGFMSLIEFEKALQQVKDMDGIENETVIMHFRIGTAGGNIPQNTHPFPLSKGVKQLRTLSLDGQFTAIAHNGIIDIDRPDKSISDTMEYIRRNLVAYRKRDKHFLQKKLCLERIQKEINGSRMVFLHPDGTFEKVGKWFEEKDGLVYSNLHWKPFPRSNYLYPYSGYGWEDYDTDNDWISLQKAMFKDRYKEVRFIPESAYFLNVKTGEMFDADSCYSQLVMDSDGKLYIVGWDDLSEEYIIHRVEQDLITFKANGYEMRYEDCDPIIQEFYESRVSMSINDDRYDLEEESEGELHD